MKNITKTIFAAAILVLMASSATAHGRRMGRGDGPRDGKSRLMKMANRLDLSEEQQAQMEQLFAEMKKEMEPLRKKQDKVRSQIDQLWMADPVNEQALMEGIEKSMRIKTKMRKLKAEFRLDILELLTPEQQDQFRAHKKDRRERKAHRGSRGGRGWGKGPAAAAKKSF